MNSHSPMEWTSGDIPPNRVSWLDSGIPAKGKNRESDFKK